jgi:hypothetical protein
MKKSHESGLATHIGPESCGAAREGGVEALTGEVHQSPAQSETPSTYGNTSHGNREIPSPPRASVALARIGKSKDARR